MADDWKPELAELEDRLALARRMGGDEKVARHHAAGKLTVRERIDALLDRESFREVGALAGRATYEEADLVDFVPANFVTGTGKIEGRPVVVGGDDFTVRGGAADAAIWQKMLHAERMANELNIPLVRLVDGTGGGGSVKTLETMGATYVPAVPGWEICVDNLAKVPVVSLALGSVAGLGAARVVQSHYSVMVRGQSQVFVAGPPVVARAGEHVDKESLGGSHIHARNGVVDDEVATEEEAFAATRRFLSYLPASVDQLPPRTEANDDPARADEWLLGAIPRNRRQAYKIRPIIESVADHGSFFEVGRLFGRSIVTGLARLGGVPVAVMAGDPMFYGGGWTADASQKVMRFVDLADTFHLPVIHLVDLPGFVVGTVSERAATVRHGARAMAAIYQATVPWCSVILRRVYGIAGAAHQSTGRLSYRAAWPSGDWGSLPLEGGIEAAYRAQLEEAEDPESLLAEITERMEAVRSPFRTAERFGIEDIIDPRQTRSFLCGFAELAAPTLRPGRTARGMRP
ncbi:MAG TPA: carboxyl transferase domain-containing protein [Acidimicrobiales bacterium]|nr:carboxyl transferase domain-containing protein [Acidimicrobiales bacterium]